MPNIDRTPAYEVFNPNINFLTFERQIEEGVNDWCADGKDGHPYFGETKTAAEAIRAQYEPA
jgi:hypothetical protein